MAATSSASAAVWPPAEGFSHLQHFVLYETQTHWYITGANKSRTHYRLLTIDRTQTYTLSVSEDAEWYTDHSVVDQRIQSLIQQSRGLLNNVTPFDALIGFIRLPLLHMIMVTNKTKVGIINDRFIYSIRDYIIKPFNTGIEASLLLRTNSQRYKLFINNYIDLNKDFYFAYYYDLTRTVQSNFRHVNYSLSLTQNHYFYTYNSQYLWNQSLIQPLLTLLPEAHYWCVPLIHGSFQQRIVQIAHRETLITLIARRSRHYAGTRYIKRGVSMSGHVANEVETEQIVQTVDAGTIDIAPCISAVVMVRGSIPLMWSQETGMSMKPQIHIAQQHHHDATKLHFDDLFKRYGPRIDILSLIKLDEKSSEFALSQAYRSAVNIMRDRYAEEEAHATNEDDQRRKPKKKRINFLTYDFINLRAAKANVLRDLKLIVTPVVEQIGVYALKEAAPLLDQNSADEEDKGRGDMSRLRYDVVKQRGVIRVNCIDCLDRTNVAQFCIGKAAIILQLKALNLLDDNTMDKYPELLSALQAMYAQHGDRIAVQYAGSGAMHKDALFSSEEDAHQLIDPLSPTAPSSLAMNTSQLASNTSAMAFAHAHNAFSFAKRLYSNNITDVEKQAALNLWLGNYLPALSGKTALWDLDPNVPLMDFDLLCQGGEEGLDFFHLTYPPHLIGLPPGSDEKWRNKSNRQSALSSALPTQQQRRREFVGASLIAHAAGDSPIAIFDDSTPRPATINTDLSPPVSPTFIPIGHNNDKQVTSPTSASFSAQSLAAGANKAAAATKSFITKSLSAFNLKSQRKDAQNNSTNNISGFDLPSPPAPTDDFSSPSKPSAIAISRPQQQRLGDSYGEQMTMSVTPPSTKTLSFNDSSTPETVDFLGGLIDAHEQTAQTQSRPLNEDRVWLDRRQQYDEQQSSRHATSSRQILPAADSLHHMSVAELSHLVSMLTGHLSAAQKVLSLKKSATTTAEAPKAESALTNTAIDTTAHTNAESADALAALEGHVKGIVD